MPGVEESHKSLVALKHIAHGDTIDQAADAMHLSRSSVEKYLQCVRRRLNARTLAHAVHIATKQGFIMLLITVVIATPTGRIAPRMTRIRTRIESAESLS
jgi:DNA-binding CsgD family transcriptional regulator